MDYCQSCGMDFLGPKHYGTQADGSPSQEYCDRCFKQGKFREQLTQEEMTAKIRTFLSQDLYYPQEEVDRIVSRIPTLKRWAH